MPKIFNFLDKSLKTDNDNRKNKENHVIETHLLSPFIHEKVYFN